MIPDLTALALALAAAWGPASLPMSQGFELLAIAEYCLIVGRQVDVLHVAGADRSVVGYRLSCPFPHRENCDEQFSVEGDSIGYRLRCVGATAHDLAPS